RFSTAVLEDIDNSSNSDGDEPADAVNVHSHDQADNDGAGWSEETATVSEEEILSTSRDHAGGRFYHCTSYE
ncbi:hypothetical protein BGZ83_005425, partial [Gryganskiella cystojenkinii]